MNELELYANRKDLDLGVFEHEYNTEKECSEFIGQLAQMTNAKVVVEIGIFEGRTSLEIAKRLPEDGELYLLDLFDNRCPELKKLMQKNKRIKFIKGDSLDSLNNLNIQADLVFYDSVHEFDHQVREFKLGESISHDRTIHAFHDSIHLPQIHEFVKWLRNWYNVVNLQTPDGRGLAIATHKSDW